MISYNSVYTYNSTKSIWTPPLSYTPNSIPHSLTLPMHKYVHTAMRRFITFNAYDSRTHSTPQLALQHHPRLHIRDCISAIYEYPYP